MAETATHKRDRSIKEIFVGKCWQYLDDNFHKFNENNKIKIALELCKKDIPQEIQGSGIETKIIIIRDTKSVEQPKQIGEEILNGRKLSFNT